ncbi:transketolase family protein [Paenibacillus chibensis]|uniref:transketolase family protein n=1 Tax=Paenibacillus chibensis TaxID=59846 RepID=UPI000FD9326D|nr:transketolase C-terminal domain-containing protein [Paenibacillus chibensis]MEC0370786.1 transketolase C-terminal domain-containing protein [Paenibacillus chibensis]
MRTTFIQSLIEEAEKDERIFLITPDMGYSILEEFQDKFPDRFLNVGIAEQNAVGVAAGLALSGKVVYIYSIIPFVTMRCFEQVRVDLAYMNTNVRLVGVGAGLSYGPAGTTHHAIEDIAIMRSLPNMTVCCPGDPVEVREIVKQSVKYNGPMFIRLGKNGEPNIHSDNTPIEIGKAIKVTQGNDVVLITTSNMLEQGRLLVEEWAKKGKHVRLISMPTIKPFDKECILELIAENIPIYTLEEHNVIGGLGTAVAEVIAESGIGVKFKRIGIPDTYTHMVGSQHYLRSELIMKSIEEK